MISYIFADLCILLLAAWPVIGYSFADLYILLLAAWWQQHGINCLELQRIAVRILSQTCSSFGCEHNWSMFDQIYSQRHNRIAQKKLDDIIYVHYNLRLRERQIRKRSSKPVSLDGVLEETLLYDWIVETEKQAVLEDEVTIKSHVLIRGIIFNFEFSFYSGIK